MTVSSARICIIGGGLAGLYAAYLLEQRGVRDYVLLEARQVWGGRIQSRSAHQQGSGRPSTSLDRFDLGPTWFWPAFQPELDRLVSDLGLERFSQFEAGEMMLEQSPNQPPRRTFGYTNSPASMRLVGGMEALVDSLSSRLKAGAAISGQTVQSLRREGQHIDVMSIDAAGVTAIRRVEQVLLAVPPRLAVENILFSPSLPATLTREWRRTATWMAPHAKYVAVYDTPFWRDAGLSGEARSAHGPLGEIHDASMPGGSAALFGFFAVPASVRQSVSEDALLFHCRAQVGRLFGPQAATPRADFLKDWASDPFTATAADAEATAGHAAPPSTSASEGDWEGRLYGVASEWSPQFSGYVAGAIEAARLGVQALMADWPVTQQQT